MRHFTITALLAASFAIAHAQTPDPCATTPQSCATLIQTHATSTTRVPNTVVDVTVGVSTSGKDLVTVQRALADSSNALTKYLQGQQVQRLITTSVSFAPEIKSDRSGPEKTLGYRGSSRVSFRAMPEKIADLLAGVMSNGANRIIDTQFTPTEEEIIAARRRLIAEATQYAISKAETIARAAGLHIVSVRTITENGAADFPVRADKMANGYSYSGFMGGQSAPKSIDEASGDTEVSIEINLEVAATR